MYCTNCGTKFEGNFCPMCGRSSSSFTPAPVANQTAELLAVDVMEGVEFENYCVSLLKNHGFTDLQTTQASGDQGVDIIGYKNGFKYAIQCKRYSSPLGNTPVQEVAAGKTFYDCQVAAVMTNSTFTTGAKELAEKTGVLLWDRSTISTLISLAGSIPCSSGSQNSPETVRASTPLLDSLTSNIVSTSEEDSLSLEAHRRFCDGLSYLMRKSKISKALLQVEFNWRSVEAEEVISLLSFCGVIDSSVGIQKPLKDRDFIFLFRQAYIEDNLPDGYYEGVSRVIPSSKALRFLLAALRFSLRIWDVFCSIFRGIAFVFKKINRSKYRNAWYTLICFAILAFFASIS